MTVPILQTKLFIPTPPRGHVSRQRLLDLLNAGILSDHRLILVSAPAGFGKTTLLSEWIAQSEVKTVWVSLSEDENDPSRFLTYLITALQKIDPTLGEDILSVLTSPQPPPIENAMPVLLNQITGLAEQAIVVLDDYHLIENQSIHRDVTFLIENLPPKIHLVILTRADPPMPLARLRARGQMTELREADLRFSIDEIASFINHIFQLDLSSKQIQSLEARTEGWIAGLQMVALSLRGKTNIEGFLSAFSGSHRFILDYLTEEVLHGKSREIKDFILQTSILERLNGSLCDAVTGQDGGRDTLEILDESNLFIIPLDDERVWYRYHHLFADVMANQLHRNYADKIPELHLRAAKWFQKNDFLQEAIYHALDGEHYDYAVKIAQPYSLHMLKTGSIPSLIRVMSKFPDELIWEYPRMTIYYVWMKMYAEKEVYIDKYLKIAKDRSKITGEYDGLRGDFPAVRAYAAHRRGDYENAYVYAQEALKSLPENNFPVRSGIHFILGRIYSKRDDFPNALTELEKASILGEKSGNLSSAVNALCSAGAIHIQLGNLGDAENVFTQAKRIATGPSGNPMPFASTVLGCLADFHVDYGDLTQAKKYALETVDLGKKWLNGDSQVRGLLALARVAHFQDQSHEAYQYLEKAKKISATNILILDAIQGIDQTEKFLQSQTFRKIRVSQDSLLEPLTERELEVLQLLAAGMSNRAIAEELVIAIGTTKAHISRIMGKLNAKNRTQAVVLARELGLISPQDSSLMENETSP